MSRNGLFSGRFALLISCQCSFPHRLRLVHLAAAVTELAKVLDSPQLARTLVSAHSFFRMIYRKKEHVMEWLWKIVVDDIKIVYLKQDVVDDYYVYSKDLFKRRLVVGGCRSWDKGGKSRVKLLAVNPGSSLHHTGMWTVI
jgi:hypothetical protein